MGLPFLSRKPMVSSMKPMAPLSKPVVTLGHQNSSVTKEHRHGMVTHGELGSITDKLSHMGKTGTALTDLLQNEADRHGGILKGRHFDRIIDKLERHHNGIGTRNIEKLEDIVDSKL